MRPVPVVLRRRALRAQLSASGDSQGHTSGKELGGLARLAAPSTHTSGPGQRGRRTKRRSSSGCGKTYRRSGGTGCATSPCDDPWSRYPFLPYPCCVCEGGGSTGSGRLSQYSGAQEERTIARPHEETSSWPGTAGDKVETRWRRRSTSAHRRYMPWEEDPRRIHIKMESKYRTLAISTGNQEPVDPGTTHFVARVAMPAEGVPATAMAPCTQRWRCGMSQACQRKSSGCLLAGSLLAPTAERGKG